MVVDLCQYYIRRLPRYIGFALAMAMIDASIIHELEDFKIEA